LPQTIALDAAQQAVASRFDALAAALAAWRRGRFRFFGRKPAPPRGLYLWGQVGRGKTMLMDSFFAKSVVEPRRRVHFNAFMTETHARIHEWRGLDADARARRPEFVREAGDDPIPPVAHAIARESALLCFDEFQVRDIADAMILGRLFEQILARDVVIVATSNTAPDRLYEGGLNRQLFLPFIALIEARLEVIELEGGRDYRLGRIAGLDLYASPLGAQADASVDLAWSRLTDGAQGHPESLEVLGRTIEIPRAAHGAARFTFDELCAWPLAAADYLAIARRYHVVAIDRIPKLDPQRSDEARRFTVLIDTLYDEGVILICSAAAAPDALFPEGESADAFRRTASRLMEMQSLDYVQRVSPTGEQKAVLQREPALAG
jgi:cell division protein ZapE